MTEIILIRHGETAWNTERRLQGHTDIALNSAGEKQALALGLALRGERLHAIIASDLQRAQQTAQAVAHWHGLPLQTDVALRERCYGAFEGMTYGEIQQRYPEEFAAFKAREVDAQLPPGEREGESFRQFYERTLTAIRAWARRYPDATIALVAHGGVLECAYRAAMEIPHGVPRSFEILNASINRIVVREDKLVLRQWAEVAHLDHTALDEIDRRAA